jgi:toxin ParE1/3/4
VAEILTAASAEMYEAAGWYEDRVSGLGGRFLDETEAAFARVEALPLTGAPWIHRLVPSGVRRMFLRSFPYAAVYVVEPRVVVVAVAHLRRRPEYWKERIGQI